MASNSDETASKVNQLMNQLSDKRLKDEEMLDNIKVVAEQHVVQFVDAFKTQLNGSYVKDIDIQQKLNVLQKILREISEMEDKFEKAKQSLDYIREHFWGKK